MRGTKSDADFETFVEAVSGFPPTRRDGMSPQEVFQHSYDLLKGLAAKEPAVSARARLACLCAGAIRLGEMAAQHVSLRRIMTAETRKRPTLMLSRP